VFAQKLDNLGEELDMPIVVTGDANVAYILLDRRADNIADRAMVPEINHFNAVPDEFQIDRVDGAVVPVANRDSGQDSNWRHLSCEQKGFQVTFRSMLSAMKTRIEPALESGYIERRPGHPMDSDLTAYWHRCLSLHRAFVRIERHRGRYHIEVDLFSTRQHF